MNNLIPRDALPGTPTAHTFHGHEHGDLPISMILVHNQPGDGPKPHRHAYPEIFVLHTGSARFRLDDASIDAREGDVVVVPAGAVHGFRNTGSGELSMTCIHTSARIASEWI
jgi:mannose-6-phosphate isomerase-like protein (cupin superfamily)